MVSLHLVNVQCLSIHPRTMSTNFAPNLSEASSPWCRPVVKASLERMPAMLLKPKTDVAMLRRPGAAKCGRTLTSSVHQLQLYPTSVYFSDCHTSCFGASFDWSSSSAIATNLALPIWVFFQSPRKEDSCPRPRPNGPEVCH